MCKPASTHRAGRPPPCIDGRQAAGSAPAGPASGLMLPRAARCCCQRSILAYRRPLGCHRGAGAGSALRRRPAQAKLRRPLAPRLPRSVAELKRSRPARLTQARLRRRGPLPPPPAARYLCSPLTPSFTRAGASARLRLCCPRRANQNGQMLQRPIVWVSFSIGALEAGRELLQRRAARLGLRSASSGATGTPSPVLGLGDIKAGEPASTPFSGKTPPPARRRRRPLPRGTFVHPSSPRSPVQERLPPRSRTVPMRSGGGKVLLPGGLQATQAATAAPATAQQGEQAALLRTPAGE